MRERTIEQRLGRDLKRLGCLYLKFVSPGTNGVPDRIVVTPWGETIYVELKTDNGRLSEMQAVQIGRLTKRGARVYAIYGVAQAESFVAQMIREVSEKNARSERKGGDAL